MAGPQDLQKPFSDEEIAEIRSKLQTQGCRLRTMRRSAATLPTGTGATAASRG